jgi:beta-phosphoglucomutase-like phosphatase (HAD superfamily)
MNALPHPDDLRVLLLDADGSLFPSEAPAFDASADVTNRFLAALGIEAIYTPEQLLATTTGKNFRTTAVDLAAAHGVRMEPAPGSSGSGGPTLTAPMLDDWVAEEKHVVSAHLGRILRPDAAVLGPLRRLAERYQLAAVSSSALSRLDECFRATGVAELIPAERRYSAEDSLPTPTSKPHPAVYLHALASLAVEAGKTIAVEDSLPGAESAVAAGIVTVGNLTFVPAEEREKRGQGLRDAGVVALVESWDELATMILRTTSVAGPGGEPRLRRTTHTGAVTG